MSPSHPQEPTRRMPDHPSIFSKPLYAFSLKESFAKAQKIQRDGVIRLALKHLTIKQ